MKKINYIQDEKKSIMQISSLCSGEHWGHMPLALVKAVHADHGDPEDAFDVLVDVLDDLAVLANVEYAPEVEEPTSRGEDLQEESSEIWTLPNWLLIVVVVQNAVADVAEVVGLVEAVEQALPHSNV